MRCSSKAKKSADDVAKKKVKRTRTTSVAAEKEDKKTRKVGEDKRGLEMTVIQSANQKFVQVEEVNEEEGSDEESLAPLVKKKRRLTKTGRGSAIATSKEERLEASPSPVHDEVDVLINNVIKDLNTPIESKVLDEVSKKNFMMEIEAPAKTASGKEHSKTAQEIAALETDFSPITTGGESSQTSSEAALEEKNKSAINKEADEEVNDEFNATLDAFNATWPSEDMSDNEASPLSLNKKHRTGM